MEGVDGEECARQGKSRCGRMSLLCRLPWRLGAHGAAKAKGFAVTQKGIAR